LDCEAERLEVRKPEQSDCTVKYIFWDMSLSWVWGILWVTFDEEL